MQRWARWPSGMLGVRVAAGRPGIDLDVLEVLDAAPSHGCLPIRVLLGDSDGVDHISEADGRLSLGDARHHDVVGVEIDGGVESTVRLLDGIVVAEETQLAGNRVARCEGNEFGLDGFDQRHGTEAGSFCPSFAHRCLDQAGGTFDLRDRGRVEGVSGRVAVCFGHCVDGSDTGLASTLHCVAGQPPPRWEPSWV